MTKSENIVDFKARIQLLESLIQVAQKTNGSEVWRALFAELRCSIVKLLEKEELS